MIRNCLGVVIWVASLRQQIYRGAPRFGMTGASSHWFRTVSFSLIRIDNSQNRLIDLVLLIPAGMANNGLS